MKIGEWVTIPTDVAGELVTVEIIDQTSEFSWVGRTQDGAEYVVLDTEGKPPWDPPHPGHDGGPV